jgi:integrase
MTSRWMIVGYPSGKRERYYYKTESEAKKAAADRNAEILAHGAQLALPPEIRREAIICLSRLQPFGKTLTDAVDFFLRHEAQVVVSVSVKEFTREIIAEFERRTAKKEVTPGHANCLKQKVTKFAQAFGDDTPIKSITGLQIKDWITSLPTSPTTRNNHLVYTRLAFSIGKEKNLVDVNPVEGVKLFESSKMNIKAPSPLSPEQMVALINACTPEILPFVVIGGFGGLRAEERHQLLWEHVKENHVDLPAAISKTGRRRLIPIEPCLAEWLKRCRKPVGPVIVLSRNQNDYEFEKVTKTAGFAKWPNNALRDAFCSYFYEKTASADRTADAAGYSIEILKKHYRELVSPEATAKFWAIYPNKSGKAEIRLSEKLISEGAGTSSENRPGPTA